jgi:aryl-alcohol dehydrogenase-like predicted oxidoreductase
MICRVEEIAKKNGVTMAQVATAWSLAKVAAPIVGTTNLKNLEELAGMSSCFPDRVHWPHSLRLAAVHIQLSEEDIKALEEPYGPQEVFGHM